MLNVSLLLATVRPLYWRGKSCDKFIDDENNNQLVNTDPRDATTKVTSSLLATRITGHYISSSGANEILCSTLHQPSRQMAIAKRSGMEDNQYVRP